MDSTSDLYSTIASITGVWLSIMIPFGLTFYTYIQSHNINYFTSLRREKMNVYSSIFSLINDCDVQFRRHTNNDCQYKLYEALRSINSMCEQQNGNTEKPLLNIDEACASLKAIIRCYPDPMELGYQFLFTEELLTNDEKYKSWIEKYEKIAFWNIRRAFDNLDTAIVNRLNVSQNTEQKELDSDIVLKALKLKTIMNGLRTIDTSINEIEVLKKDYEPTNTCFELIKRKSMGYWILGTLLFGIILPIYMLLPNQFGWLHSESLMIFIIFIGLSVSILFTLNNIAKILNLLIKK